MALPELLLRKIEPTDDVAVARIIRSVMPEFGADGEGYAILDPEVDRMCATYSAPRSAYWVVCRDEVVVGGGGYGPLAGGDADTAELRKMYFLPEARGLGAGKALMTQCLQAAADDGFGRMYLETLTQMAAARALYERFGFQRLTGPRGHTGHFGCNTWYAREL
jgi:putative acetyltransferase